MSTLTQSPVSLVRRFVALLMSVSALALLGIQTAHAASQTGGTVSYSPTLQTVSGNMPFSTSYVLSVKSPANFPVGQTATIGFTINPTAFPASMTTAQALACISITPVASGTFTGANQTLNFNVALNFPVVTPPVGSNSVSYTYQIYTNSWPSAITGQYIDFGASVGATATVPATGGGNIDPPTVSITSPADGDVITYPYGTVFPVSVPLTFHGQTPTGSLVETVDATLNGLPLVVVNPVLPLGSVDATASLLITGPGTYTIRARAANSVGTDTDTATITVVVAAPLAPPAVNITTPADGSTITVASTAFPTTVPLQFTSVSTSPTVSPITAVSASVDGTPVAVTSTGLNTTSVTSTGSMLISTPGAHQVTATATNGGGTATDVNTFTVVVTAAPPTVVINTPTPNSVYTYRMGSAATVVPFSFTAKSNFGGILTLTAKVDNVSVDFTPSGLGTLTATGLINLPYTTAGTHTVSVTTTDNYGTASATSNFTVTVIAPTPAITISQPANGSTFTVPFGSTTVNIPYTFTTTSNNGFVVDGVTASLDGTAISIGNTTGLGTATAVSTGTLMNVSPGTHTLVATGTSSGVTVSTSTVFTVTAVQPPPSVVITAPAVGSTYTRISCGPALSIPLTFTGTSNATNGVITQLKATLNGTPLSVSSTNLGQKVAYGSATMNVTSAGTYTINVTAIDAVGTASATRTFTVTIVQPRTVYGSVFFDVDADGNYESEDFGLSGISVQLLNSANQMVAADITDCSGEYSLENIAPGTYTVVAKAGSGLTATTVSQRTVTVAGYDVNVAKFGFGLSFASLRTMKANGYTIGYWKNNLDKAIAGSCNGVQVSKSTLTCYTNKIGDFALSPFDCITMKTASSTMGYSGSTPSSLLAKQLIASEYNYQNGAYLNGDRTLTMLFLTWGEYVLANPSKFSSTYIIWTKDWFDAYNNSHGGLVAGPK